MHCHQYHNQYPELSDFLSNLILQQTPKIAMFGYVKQLSLGSRIDSGTGTYL